ncbi:MAG: hypothetical protein ACRD3E_10940 [Terriglobales bacterium]
MSTNSPAILNAARLAFPDGPTTQDLPAGLRLDIRVSARMENETLRSPICRGRDHLAFCYLGGGSAIVFDYANRAAVGLVSEAIAANADYWRTTVFPFAMGVMSPVLGVVPLHAACFQHEGATVIIGARSGAGKSTLAATYAKRGLTYISDDWAYLTGDRGLRLYSLPVGLKLLPDATTFFPELTDRPVTRAENGEMSFEVDPAAWFGARRAYKAVPNIVILYDRVPGSELNVRRATREDLRNWFSESLDCVPDCLSFHRDEQLALLDRLASCTCYVVTTDGAPEEIATQLLRICHGEFAAGPPLPCSETSAPRAEDLLRRSVGTPIRNTVMLSDAAVEIMTDAQAVARQFQTAKKRIATFSIAAIAEPLWPCRRLKFGYCHRSLGYTSFGRDGFIAFNSDRGEAAAFLGPTATRNGIFRRALERLCARSLTVAGIRA